MQLKTYCVQYRNPFNFKIAKYECLQADGLLTAMVIAYEDAKANGIEVAQLKEKKEAK